MRWGRSKDCWYGPGDKSCNNEVAIAALNVTKFAKRGLIHTSDYATLQKHNFFCEQDIELKFYFK